MARDHRKGITTAAGACIEGCWPGKGHGRTDRVRSRAAGRLPVNMIRVVGWLRSKCGHPRSSSAPTPCVEAVNWHKAHVVVPWLVPSRAVRPLWASFGAGRTCTGASVGDTGERGGLLRWRGS